MSRPLIKIKRPNVSPPLKPLFFNVQNNSFQNRCFSEYCQFASSMSDSIAFLQRGVLLYLNRLRHKALSIPPSHPFTGTLRGTSFTRCRRVNRDLGAGVESDKN